jgi:DNA primase
LTIERIPNEEIDNIRSKFDIVEIISRYIELKKKGRTYFGLCPFHSEKTSSFAVSPDKQIFHCFGCGAGGNIYSFLMNIEGWSFIEAVKKLADEAGINILFQEDNSNELYMRNQLLRAHELASKFYQYILLETEMGNHALEYLYNRGFSKQVIEEFKLGFAPSNSDTILKFLSKRGFSEDELVAAGLITRNKNQAFDRFRNRVMFPIWDSQGKVIAFGGRIIGSGEPKYLNTSDTIIFNKSRVLYNLHRARSDIRMKGEAIVFEGYIDVIAAYQKGIKNTIATLGTSLTEEQAKILRRNVEKIALVYDGDNAGKNAALRATTILENENLNVGIAQLPNGLDPDDYFKTNSIEAFEQLINDSISKVQLQTQLIREKYSFDNGEDKVNYAMEVVHIIGEIDQSPKREYLLKELSKEVNLSVDSLREELEKYRIKQKKANNVNNREKRWNNHINYGKHSHNHINSIVPAFQKAEQEILWIMIHNLEFGKLLADKIKGNFLLPEHSLLAARIYSYYHTNLLPSVSRLLDDFQEQPEVIRIITSMQFQFIDDDLLSEEKIKDCINTVEKHSIEVEMRNLQSQLEIATKTGKQELIVELLKKIQDKQKNIKLLRK